MVFLLQQISLMLSCEVIAWSPKPEDSFTLTYMETMVLGDPELSHTQGLAPLVRYQNADTKHDPCVDEKSGLVTGGVCHHLLVLPRQ